MRLLTKASVLATNTAINKSGTPDNILQDYVLFLCNGVTNFSFLNAFYTFN
jgi:hypothetical protein